MTPFAAGEQADLDVEGAHGIMRVRAFISAVADRELQFSVASAVLEPPPRVGAPVHLHVVRNDGVYSAETRLLSVRAPTDLVVGRPEQARCVQRRAAFRVACSMPISFALVEPLQPVMAGLSDGKGLVRDLSADGIRFHGNGAINTGALIVVEIDLGESAPLVITTRVVRVEALPGGRWETSGFFVGLTAAMGARLSRFVLLRERRDRLYRL